MKEGRLCAAFGFNKAQPRHWKDDEIALTEEVAIPSRDPARVARWRAWDEHGEAIAPTDFPGARAIRGERVVPGQNMLYTDDDGREIWTRVSAVPICDAAGQVIAQTGVISDIDASKRSAEALRESEERQVFLLRLSDALAPLTDAAAIQEEACRLLGEQMERRPRLLRRD